MSGVKKTTGPTAWVLPKKEAAPKWEGAGRRRGKKPTEQLAARDGGKEWDERKGEILSTEMAERFLEEHGSEERVSKLALPQKPSGR